MEEFKWTMIFKLLFVAVLVAANGLFVAAEFSLVAIRRSRVEQMSNEGHRLAPGLLKASDNLGAFLAATQLGITLSSLGLGWIRRRPERRMTRSASGRWQHVSRSHRLHPQQRYRPSPQPIGSFQPTNQRPPDMRALEAVLNELAVQGGHRNSPPAPAR